ncbi:MAG: hypothetical protein H8D97_00855 [Proteobacteria bacterium]|nr:hypothetical protein [Pseudomonadota bacterium]
MRYYNGVCSEYQTMIENGVFYSIDDEMYIMRSHNFTEGVEVYDSDED